MGRGVRWLSNCYANGSRKGVSMSMVDRIVLFHAGDANDAAWRAELDNVPVTWLALDFWTREVTA